MSQEQRGHVKGKASLQRTRSVGPAILLLQLHALIPCHVSCVQEAGTRHLKVAGPGSALHIDAMKST